MADTISQISASVDALMHEFDVITHNLANVSTVGYKRRCTALFESLLAQESNTEQEPNGSVTPTTSIDFSQGHFVQTDRPLDLALFGKGFFVIETPEGPLYTRNGMFQINQNGQIVNSDGRLVAGEAGPITIPTAFAQSQLHVTSEGTISAGGTTIGKLRLVDFPDNEDKLVPAGGSCYRMPEAIEPVAAANIAVRQGYQEASNVRTVDELVDMIIVSRLYEANMKAIAAQKEASSSIIEVAAS
jgi:flagellar basal-body rod protein FlgF